MRSSTMLSETLVRVSEHIWQGGTLTSALGHLSESEEVLVYEAFEQAAAARYPESGDANVGGDDVEIKDDGAWVVRRVWIPTNAIGLN